MGEPGRPKDSVDGFLAELGEAPVPADLASAVAAGVRSHRGRRSSSTPWCWASAIAAVLVIAIVGVLVFRAPAGVVSSPTPTVGLPSLPATSAASPSPSPGATPTDTLAHYSNGGVALDYPASWTVHETFPSSAGLGQTIAILGNQPWGACMETDINCHYGQHLEPGQVTVELDSVLLATTDICTMGRTRSDLAGRGSGDPVATGSLTRVAGRPALRTDYAVNGTDYYRSDEWHTWTIARPGSIQQAFVVSSKVRGPGLQELDAEVERLIDSVAFQPPVANHQADDCGAPFPSPEPSPTIEPTASIAPSDDAWAACSAVISTFTTVEGSAVVAAYLVTGAEYAHWRTDRDARAGQTTSGPFYPPVPLDGMANVCYFDGLFSLPGYPGGPDYTREIVVIVDGFAQEWSGGPKEGIAIEDPRLSVWPSPGPVGDGLDNCQSNMPQILAALPSSGDYTVVAGFDVTAGALVNRQENVFVDQAFDYQSAWRQQPSDLPVLMCYLDGTLETKSEQAAGTSREGRFVVLLNQEQVVVDSYGPRDRIWVTDPRGWPTQEPGSPIRSDFTTVQLPVGGGQSLKLRIDHGAFKPYLVSARPATPDEVSAAQSDQLAPIGASNLTVAHPGGDLFSVIVSWQGSCDTEAHLTISMDRDVYALDEGPRTQCSDAPATRAVLLTFNKHSLSLDAVVEFHPGVVN